MAHAHLAGQLARHWQLPAFAGLAPREQLLAAVSHHDDGWENWDRQPGVAQGKPISFLEMPFGEATAIWRKSIEIASGFGPAAGYVVAGHFCALIERFASDRADAPSKRTLADAFLTAYRRRMQTWLAEVPTAEQAGLSQHGVAALQLFDALSLWLCCEERNEPESFATPGGPTLTLTPQSAGLITISPWPLDLRRLELSATGQRIPRFHYANEAELAALPAEPAQLRWQLLPDA